MATDRVPFTLLHISDLHFGDKLGGQGVDQLSAALPLLIRFPRFDGLLGHHYKALSALHDFYKQLWNRAPTSPVVVTGDITANGAVTQFDLAHLYLGDETPGADFELGLGLAQWPSTSISGNHDQWPGSNVIFGRHTAGLKKYFKQPFPIVAPPLEIRRGLALRFLFIDTDAGVSPFGHNRFLARGEFVSQLVTLREQIPAVARGEIRVLVMHHSLMPAPPQSPSATVTPQRRIAFPRAMEITSGTRKVLDHFLVDYGIKIIMCGHLHVPRLTKYHASNGTEATTVLEARCGTTTQRDEYPYELVQKMSAERRLPPNTLILHRVIERSRSLLWRSEIFWRNRSGRFVGTSEYDSPSLPKKLVAEIELLPSGATETRA
jgi:Calcineurin-like phosphoesterase